MENGKKQNPRRDQVYEVLGSVDGRRVGIVEPTPSILLLEPGSGIGGCRSTTTAGQLFCLRNDDTSA